MWETFPAPRISAEREKEHEYWLGVVTEGKGPQLQDNTLTAEKGLWEGAAG